MDTKSKLLVGLFFAFIVAATVWKYHVFFVKKDFTIISYISCDPLIEVCFVNDCSTEDEECDATPFKKITKNAYNISDCSGEGCSDLNCTEGERGCVITTCSEETVGEDEVCFFQVINDEEESGELGEEITPDNVSE